MLHKNLVVIKMKLNYSISQKLRSIMIIKSHKNYFNIMYIRKLTKNYIKFKLKW